MTCKDCLHYEVCIRRQNSISLDPMKCGYKCPEFKNKADFVELEAITAKTHTCPLFHDKNCVPMACGCGKVDMFTCRRLYRAYHMGCVAEAERIKAKAKKQEATPEILNTKIHIQETKEG